MAKNKVSDSAINAIPFGATHFPPIGAGAGGFQLEVARRKELIEQHKAGGGAVALNPWGDWYGANAASINGEFIESSIGGPIADTTWELYIGHIAQWPAFRRIDGRSPYITPDSMGLRSKRTSYFRIYPFPRSHLARMLRPWWGAWAQLAIAIG